AKSVYVRGQNRVPYRQVYDATLDQTSLQPSIEVRYALKSGGKVLEALTDLAGASVQFFSGQRVVVLGKVPLKENQPGKYTLEVAVLDKVSNRSVLDSTDFKVN